MKISNKIIELADAVKTVSDRRDQLEKLIDAEFKSIHRLSSYNTTMVAIEDIAEQLMYMQGDYDDTIRKLKMLQSVLDSDLMPCTAHGKFDRHTADQLIEVVRAESPDMVESYATAPIRDLHPSEFSAVEMAAIAKYRGSEAKFAAQIEHRRKVHADAVEEAGMKVKSYVEAKLDEAEDVMKAKEVNND